MTPTLSPLTAFARPDLEAVKAILTDIDDTLTLHGRLPATAYKAMEDLHKAGLIVVRHDVQYDLTLSAETLSVSGAAQNRWLEKKMATPNTQLA